MGSLNVKSSTINKVTLVIFLICLAISSVFALSTTTIKFIQGTTPSIFPVNKDDAFGFTIRVTKDKEGNNLIGKENALHVGNYVHLQYRLIDLDGDKDSVTSSLILPSLKVFKHGERINENQDQVNDWMRINLSKPATFKTKDGIDTITFQLDEQFLGADCISVIILGRTEYGIPSVGNWLVASDILSRTRSAYPWKSKEDDIDDLDNRGPGLNEILTNSTDGPGDTVKENGMYPVEGDNFKLGIFKLKDKTGSSTVNVEKVDLSFNYASSKTNPPGPQYGQNYGAMIWNDLNDNDTWDKGELIMSAYYSYEWSLTGEDYEGIPPAKKVLTKEEGVPYEFAGGIFLGSTSGKGHNAIYTTPENGYKAGAQGYLLGLKALPGNYSNNQ